MKTSNNAGPSRAMPLRWLVPILLLAPLSLAAKGCNSAEMGDDCPADAKCDSGTAGSGTAGSGNGGGVGQVCGGLQGLGCARDLFCQFEPTAQCGVADQTGTCQVKPDVCDDVYAPVCGCDDKTYGNACEANGEGVSVARAGECAATPGETCGGIQGLTCAAGQYCRFPAGSACGSGDQTGACTAKPEGCTKIYMPVCGCDGMTYGNECSAASAGVSVAAQGECGSSDSGTLCGGIQGLTCGKGEYCSFPAGAQCGSGDRTGTCAPMPDACDLVYSPVCGCDGMTYGNDCAAASAGVSVASQGECGGQSCGATPCEGNTFCDYPPEAMCGAADGSGVCRPVPDICTDDVDPVCGCDDKTYSNACSANAKGVSVASPGACK